MTFYRVKVDKLKTDSQGEPTYSGADVFEQVIENLDVPALVRFVNEEQPSN